VVSATDPYGHILGFLGRIYIDLECFVVLKIRVVLLTKDAIHLSLRRFERAMCNTTSYI
jgi:hypothetical protein